MHNLKEIRKDFETFKKALERRLVDVDFDKLKEPTEDEEDMLDLAHGLTHTSRLGCQIIMTEELDGLKVKVPSGTRNINVE